MDRDTSSCATPDDLQPTALPPGADWHARIAFAVGLFWLGLVAIALHFYEHSADAEIFWPAAAAIAALTPVFWVEAVYHFVCGSANQRQIAWGALLPALRLGARDPVTNTRIWLPGLGWREVNPKLEREVNQALSTPMLVVSLLVLPVIAVEFAFAERMEADLRLARLTQLGTALIWWAFTVEFILMVSITQKRLDYCRKHWLDIAIILLPLLSFLRALRLGRLLRLQNLSKTARMYKLRGVAMRTYRALLLVEAVRRLIQGAPEQRLEKLRKRLIEHEAQSHALRVEIAELEATIAAANVAVDNSVDTEGTEALVA